MAVGVVVVVQVVRDFLVHAAGTAVRSAVNAGFVEGRVVRAEVASAAVPQRGHCGEWNGQKLSQRWMQGWRCWMLEAVMTSGSIQVLVYRIELQYKAGIFRTEDQIRMS